MVDFYYISELEHYQPALDYLDPYLDPALDTETYTLPEWKGKGGSALDPHTGRISLLILKARETIPVLFDLLLLEQQSYDREPLYRYLLTREKLIAHYGQFDAKFLKRHFGEVFDNFFCTRTAAKLLSNATGSKFGKACGHGLADLTRDYLNIHLSGKGKEQISDWYPRPTDKDRDSAQGQTWHDKLEYAANDVIYLHELHDILVPVLTNPLPYTDILRSGSQAPPYGLGMAQVLETEMLCVSVAAEMEYNGIPASREVFTKLQKAIWDRENSSGRYLEVAAELCQMLGLDTYPSVWTDYEIPAAHSLKILNNPNKLKDLVNKSVGTHLDSVQAAVLERLLDLFQEVEANGRAEFVNEEEADQFACVNATDELEVIERSSFAESSKLCSLVVEYKRLMKLEGMDVRKFINPVTGCIHSHLDMLGAATGRSCIAQGQRVSVPGNSVPIEQIKVGDLVYCYTTQGNPVLRKVLNTWCKGETLVVKLHWHSIGRQQYSGSLVCTPDHRIRTKHQGWVQAGKLNPFDSLIHLGHRVTKVESAGRAIVYDLEVEETHNFIVEGVCVSNSSSTPNTQQISGRTFVEIEMPSNNLFPSSANYDALIPDWQAPALAHANVLS